ncbi:MAG TPA: F0F1 ATP synthase subunit A [Edaphocola sp.]|nr:F0F1 ATP synthase subunit A [Edaphocola sp.]
MSINFKHFITSIALLLTSFSVFAFQADTAQAVAPATQEVGHHEGEMNISEVIFGHVKDAYEWHVFSLGDFEATIHFPVILYSPTKGLSIFSSSEFGTHEAPDSYEGYRLEGGNNIVAEDGSKVYDFSLTKNVVAMLAAVILMLIVFIRVSNKYKRNGSDKAPSGFQNAVEVCIEFIQDEVAKPALGVHYRRFMPLLLTIFFFIWITSMLGLIPGGANLTGNIAVTCCLAVIAFAVMLFSSKKHFWGHLFNPPGMPFFVKVILVPIELISLIIKPTALMIRLFANMLAGHIVLICFALLIFIFAEMNVFIGSGFSVISVALSTFSMLIELLVAAIQAYIFAFLTAIFVGQMIEEHSHDSGERGYGFTDTEAELML